MREGERGCYRGCYGRAVRECDNRRVVSLLGVGGTRREGKVE